MFMYINVYTYVHIYINTYTFTKGTKLLFIVIKAIIINIKSWPEGGSSVAMARQFLQDFFTRKQLTEEETRQELDSAHWYVATCPKEYSKFVRQSAPAWVVAIHSEAPPGSLNDYETNWGRYDRQQPANSKRHLGMKTGLQGHVHTLPAWREGPNRWAGEPDVHGMVDKEEVRELLERQDDDDSFYYYKK